MTSSLGELFDLLRRLESAKIAYELRHSRYNAIMVEVDVRGEHWEIEFLQDGDVEVEIYRSGGRILGREALEDLFARHSD